MEGKRAWLDEIERLTDVLSIIISHTCKEEGRKMEGAGTWFDELERRGVPLSETQRQKINEKMREILSYEPRVGIFGKTGVGKSSLCNALFGQVVCPISDIAACTRNPQEVILNVGTKGIKLLDVPGVGENLERDEEYAALYAKLLPELDLVLWLVKADDRAMASDEKFFKNVVKPHLEQGKPFFFVINQVDKIEPYREWNDEKHEPGPQQFQNIHKKIHSVSEQFSFPASKVVPVSASERYNLAQLVDEVVFALPKEKTVTMFRAVDDAFKSETAEKQVKKNFLEIVGDVIQGVAEGAKELVKDVVFDAGVWLINHLPWWWPL